MENGECQLATHDLNTCAHLAIKDSTQSSISFAPPRQDWFLAG